MELISSNKNVTVVGDALFAVANRKFEDSTYNDRILELPLLTNRDQELIDLILTNKIYTFRDLPKMGLRAQSAAPRLLNEFKALKSLSYFEVLSNTMKEIKATRNTFATSLSTRPKITQSGSERRSNESAEASG